MQRNYASKVEDSAASYSLCGETAGNVSGMGYVLCGSAHGSLVNPVKLPSLRITNLEHIWELVVMNKEEVQLRKDL